MNLPTETGFPHVCSEGQMAIFMTAPSNDTKVVNKVVAVYFFQRLTHHQGN